MLQKVQMNIITRVHWGPHGPLRAVKVITADLRQTAFTLIKQHSGQLRQINPGCVFFFFACTPDGWALTRRVITEWMRTAEFSQWQQSIWKSILIWFLFTCPRCFNWLVFTIWHNQTSPDRWITLTTFFKTSYFFFPLLVVPLWRRTVGMNLI